MRTFTLLPAVVWLACAACGSEGTVPLPSTGLLADAARVCFFGWACPAAPPWVDNIGYCTFEWLMTLAWTPDGTDGSVPFDELVGCAHTSKDCASWVKCATRGHAADYCAAHPNWSCDGNVAVGCGLDAPPWIRDCDALGARCQTVFDGTRAICTDGTVCPANGDQVCLGDRVDECATDAAGTPMTVQFRCAAGKACGEHVEYSPDNGRRFATCDAPACDASSVRCEGDTLVLCSNANLYPGPPLWVVRKIDCAAAGMVCREGAAHGCVPEGADCAPDARLPERCEGGAVVGCIQGRWTRFDCSLVGLTKCVPAPQGSDACSVICQ